MWAMSRALLCGKNIHSSYKCLIWFQWLQIINKNFKSKVSQNKTKRTFSEEII